MRRSRLVLFALMLVAASAMTSADERAPERFRVRLATTKGDVVIACTRAWAPLGADRFYTLVRAGYFDDSAWFRVVKGKWAQFGIAGAPAVAQAWRGKTFPDDPRLDYITTARID